MPTRLPAFDCSANGPCSEVDSDAQHSRGYGAEKNEPANPSGANFFRRRQVEIVFACEGPARRSLCEGVMAALARETFTMASRRMQRDAVEASGERARLAC